MRIGIAQINTVAGAFDQTVERMVAQSQRAAEQGVEEAHEKVLVHLHAEQTLEPEVGVRVDVALRRERQARMPGGIVFICHDRVCYALGLQYYYK